MRVIIIILIIALLGGAGFWIWKINQDQKPDAADITTSVTAFNQTKNADAATVSASARDVIVYTLTVSNQGDKVYPGYVVEVNIGDLTQSATLIDAQGANYNSTNNSLVWTPLDVPASGSFDKKFTVRVKDAQDANADYVMSVSYPNELDINIDRPSAEPTPTPTPNPPYSAPATGPSAIIVLMLAAGFTLGFLLFRQARRMGSSK
jgi:hypothetical protein